MQNEQISAKGKEVQIRLLPRGWMVDSVQRFTSKICLLNHTPCCTSVDIALKNYANDTR